MKKMRFGFNIIVDRHSTTSAFLDSLHQIRGRSGLNLGRCFLELKVERVAMASWCLVEKNENGEREWG